MHRCCVLPQGVRWRGSLTHRAGWRRAPQGWAGGRLRTGSISDDELSRDESGVTDTEGAEDESDE